MWLMKQKKLWHWLKSQKMRDSNQFVCQKAKKRIHIISAFQVIGYQIFLIRSTDTRFTKTGHVSQKRYLVLQKLPVTIKSWTKWVKSPKLFKSRICFAISVGLWSFQVQLWALEKRLWFITICFLYRACWIRFPLWYNWNWGSGTYV